MFRHEDIIIVVSYYEKLGRGYRPSRSHLCVYLGWGRGASRSHLCVYSGREGGVLFRCSFRILGGWDDY